MILLVNSGMIIQDEGIYQSLDGRFKIYLNKGDIAPQIDNELQTLKLVK